MPRSPSPDRRERRRDSERGSNPRRNRSRSPDRSDRDRNRDRDRGQRSDRSRSRERKQHRSRSREKQQVEVSNPNSIHSRLVAASGKSRRHQDDTSSRTVWGNVGAEEEYELQKRKEKGEDVPEEKKEKANFGLTGALAKDEETGNMYNGVLLKWTEPLDAAAPPRGWRIYVFKGDDIVETLYLHRQSAYLCGREKRVADHVLAHPSCSGQHAVIQFRAVMDRNRADGVEKKVVKPYIMDLASTNKTSLNGVEIEDSRYYELKEKDVIKFGHSTREYVVIRETE
jgi:smad nuclear-interacting protein 1